MSAYEKEYKAKIKDWAERIEKDIMNITQYLYPELMKVIKEMKKEAEKE